jgi:hypothetical protein
MVLMSGPCKSERVLGTRKTIVSGREVFVMEAAKCDDTAACQESFVIDGDQFVVEDCLPGDFSGAPLVAVSELSISEARTIPGAAPDERLAGRRRPPIVCGEWVALVNVKEADN